MPNPYDMTCERWYRSPQDRLTEFAVRHGGAPVAKLVVVLALGACAGIDDHVSGTVVEVIDTEDPSTGALVVELDERTIVGSSAVQLNYDRAVLQCVGGGEAAAADLAPGDEVQAVLYDSDEVDTMQPPGVRAVELRVDC